MTEPNRVLAELARAQVAFQARAITACLGTPPTPDQASARAACDAGYITPPEYLDMAKRYGWVAQTEGGPQ